MMSNRISPNKTTAEKAEGKSPTKLSLHKFSMKSPILLEKWKPVLCVIDCSSITNWDGAAIYQNHFKDDDYMCTDTNSKGDTRKRIDWSLKNFRRCSLWLVFMKVLCQKFSSLEKRSLLLAQFKGTKKFMTQRL